MLKPLPCPWCGTTPDTFPQNPKVEGNAWGEVRCTNNDCHAGGVSVGDGEDGADDRGSDKYIQCAIRRWNDRK